MKKHTLYTYEFSELSEEAKKFAIRKFERMGDLYGWHSQNKKSIEEFAKWVGAETDYEVDFYGFSYAKIKLHIWSKLNFYEVNLQGQDLKHFLETEHSWNENTFELKNDEYPFTGYYMDGVLLDPFRKAANEGFEEETTLQDLLDQSADAWLKAYLDDWRYAYSDKGISEFIEGNDFQFLENGEIFDLA